MRKPYYEQIEHEVVMLLRRADFKRTLDGSARTMDRSAYLLLKWLDREGPSAVGVISEAFQLDNSTISRQIAALDTKGWIHRYSHPEDARISMVEITKSGREAIQAAKALRLEAYAELLNDWTEDELDIFSKLLSRLNRSIEQRKRLQSNS
ncbi:MarR family winged helix-turn-helix transcriptional regulator [Brevibacillus sp. B_LB10_24]|uniref:MarR family winged helix-turn-helix transcriptional regulator n=1 Tax=Brevibacillus sp. B_LB10_24 TaxID=3380645 RepID=UPI0038B8B60E